MLLFSTNCVKKLLHDFSSIFCKDSSLCANPWNIKWNLLVIINPLAIHTKLRKYVDTTPLLCNLLLPPTFTIPECLIEVNDSRTLLNLLSRKLWGIDVRPGQCLIYGRNIFIRFFVWMPQARKSDVVKEFVFISSYCEVSVASWKLRRNWNILFVSEWSETFMME